jgi:uncharacterized protein (TIGR03435 family)
MRLPRNMTQCSGTIILTLAVITTAAIPLLSQTPPTEKPSFEAAAVRLNNTPSVTARTINAGSLIYTNVVLAEYIQLAYGLKYRQLSGPPKLYQDRYDIVAKASGPVSQDEIKLMLRGLLEDRFQLKFHRETRETAVDALVLAKNGPTFHASTTDGPLERKITRDAYQFRNASMADLAELLNNLGDRLVIDKTALAGRYDFDLKVYDMPVPSKADAIQDIKRSLADAIAASIPSALQTLGLKLVAQRAMVDFMIVDSLQKPTEN